MDGTETVTVVVVVGALITVTLAVPEPAYVLLAAFAAAAFTAYVPGAALAGAVSVRAAAPTCPGLSVMTEEDSVPAHPEGWPELRLNVLAGHPAASLFFTETL